MSQRWTPKVHRHNILCPGPNIKVVHCESDPKPSPSIPFAKHVEKNIESIFDLFKQILQPDYIKLLRNKFKSKDDDFMESDIGKEMNYLINTAVPNYIRAKRIGAKEKFDLRQSVLNSMNRFKLKVAMEIGFESDLWIGPMRVKDEELSLIQRMKRYRNRMKRLNGN